MSDSVQDESAADGEPVTVDVTPEAFDEMTAFVHEHLRDTVKGDGDRMRWYPWHSAGYRFDHIMSVVNLADRIARGEDADVDVVRVGALFHDVAKFEVKQEKHAEEGAWVAEKYLDGQGYPERFVDRVAGVITDHTEDLDDDLPLESAVVIEADSIDKIGVAGATLMAMRVGYESRSHDDVPGMIDRVINRGENILERLRTDTARRIARERLERVTTYRDWFEDEIPNHRAE